MANYFNRTLILLSQPTFLATELVQLWQTNATYMCHPKKNKLKGCNLVENTSTTAYRKCSKMVNTALILLFQEHTRSVLDKTVLCSSDLNWPQCAKRSQAAWLFSKTQVHCHPYLKLNIYQEPVTICSQTCLFFIIMPILLITIIT